MSRVEAPDEVPVVNEQYRNRQHDSRQQTIKNHVTVALSSADPVLRDRAVKELQRFKGDSLVDECLRVVAQKREKERLSDVAKARLAALKRGNFVKKIK